MVGTPGIVGPGGLQILGGGSALQPLAATTTLAPGPQLGEPAVGSDQVASGAAQDTYEVCAIPRKAPELRVIIPLCFSEEARTFIPGIIKMHKDHLPNTKLTGSFLAGGVRQTVSDYEQFLNAPFILRAMRAAIMDGVDGIFLPIAFDTAISAAKCFGIPVVGALESAVAQARTLCRKFSILAINDEEVAVDYRLSREYGFGDMLASVEPIDIGVNELFTDVDHTTEALVKAGHRALERGAQAMVLGCTAMSFAARKLAERLAVPVLDTHLIGLYMLEADVRLGLKPSPLEYRKPSGLVELTPEEYTRLQELTFLIHEARNDG